MGAIIGLDVGSYAMKAVLLKDGEFSYIRIYNEFKENESFKDQLAMYAEIVLNHYASVGAEKIVCTIPLSLYKKDSDLKDCIKDKVKTSIIPATIAGKLALEKTGLAKEKDYAILDTGFSGLYQADVVEGKANVTHTIQYSELAMKVPANTLGSVLDKSQKDLKRLARIFDERRYVYHGAQFPNVEEAISKVLPRYLMGIDKILNGIKLPVYMIGGLPLVKKSPIKNTIAPEHPEFYNAMGAAFSAI